LSSGRRYILSRHRSISTIWHQQDKANTLGDGICQLWHLLMREKTNGIVQWTHGYGWLDDWWSSVCPEFDTPIGPVPHEATLFDRIFLGPRFPPTLHYKIAVYCRASRCSALFFPDLATSRFSVEAHRSRWVKCWPGAGRTQDRWITKNGVFETLVSPRTAPDCVVVYARQWPEFLQYAENIESDHVVSCSGTCRRA
jgi:hypothetical protein